MKEIIKEQLNLIYRWLPVWFRAFLYFFVPYLGIVGEKLSPFADKDIWPSKIKWIVFNIVAIGAGLVAVRAYFDGSAQRHGEKLNGAGHQTDLFVKRQEPPKQNVGPYKQV